ncbi:hypothetical protein [uncultured Pseudoteredinibacter sp.]|uniref:hypothetical protein n=1 Tax=uncultured Pseudoteredinibacter sp. TaxID=1641701 RepID=UPI00260732C7|nr:hypothetical protein [uncultured Pseudoteredinibacter sp.]
MNSQTTIKIYYWLSPLFLISFALWGSDIRINIPGASPSLHYLYLAACFVVPSLLLKRPTMRALFALGESALNIFLLLYGVLLRYLEYIDIASQGGQALTVMSRGDMLHFMMAAVILGMGFYGNPLVKEHQNSV